MYLIDTTVISEVRKQGKANRGVIEFFNKASAQDEAIYLSVVTLGELRRGVGLIRDRGDEPQAKLLDTWLADVVGHSTISSTSTQMPRRSGGGSECRTRNMNSTSRSPRSHWSTI